MATYVQIYETRSGTGGTNGEKVAKINAALAETGDFLKNDKIMGYSLGMNGGEMICTVLYLKDID